MQPSIEHSKLPILSSPTACRLDRSAARPSATASRVRTRAYHGVAESVAQVLSNRFPGFQIVGTCAPPFRPLTTTEDDEIIERINNSGADVLRVALGTPRQERWMCVRRVCGSSRSPPHSVVVGVGAAFDFVAGKKCQAPEWMRERGLEWLFRLLQEPRRLWFRYLGYGPEFTIRIAREQLSFRLSRAFSASISSQDQGVWGKRDRGNHSRVGPERTGACKRGREMDMAVCEQHKNEEQCHTA